MTPKVGTAIGETLADLVRRAEQAERERDQACEGESLRAQERDEARFNASTYESAATKALAELDAMKQTVKAYAKSRDEATDEARKAEAALAEATLQAHNQGYEQGRLAGMGVMVAILRRCEPFIAGLTRSHKPLKHDAQRLYDDIIGAIKSAENTEGWRDHYTF